MVINNIIYDYYHFYHKFINDYNHDYYNLIILKKF